MQKKKFLNYGKAFGLIKMTKKRVKMSPYSERYHSDDIVYLSYAGRAVPLTNGIDPLKGYNKLRKGVAIFDVPEKPLSIKGPDAGKFMDQVGLSPEFQKIVSQASELRTLVQAGMNVRI